MMNGGGKGQGMDAEKGKIFEHLLYEIFNMDGKTILQKQHKR